MGYVNDGFKSIKMKVGLNIDADEKNVKAVRDAIGFNIELMIDANHAYSYDEALKLSKRLENMEIKWFEEPLSPEFYDQYSHFKAKSQIAVAAGECEYLRYGFQKLLDKNCIDFLQMDICSCGGLTEAKRISSLSSAKGVKVVPHTWGSGIAFFAAINFISNLEPIPGRLYQDDAYIEYDRTENKIRENVIKNDIVIFGIGVLLFIIITLWFVFKKIVWIIVPLSSCIFSVVVMMGMLGLLGWRVTVISSNFIALMLILTMAMNIHLSTRFLQIKNEFPSKSKIKILEIATSKMFLPILYTGLTTICAFLSLIFSGIKPVIDFGWMMTIGLITSMITTFTLLPTFINLSSDNNISVSYTHLTLPTKRIV